MFHQRTVKGLKSILMGGTAVMVGLSVASAQDTTVSTERTTPVVTSTDGNVTIDSNGSVVLDSGVGVTIDSDNTVVNDGEITMGDVDGATGVLVNGDVTFSYTQSGDILLDNPETTDSEVPFDYDDDRYGFRIAAGSYTGDVTFSSGSVVYVEGDNSASIAIEGGLTGDVVIGADVAAIGENSTGVRISGDVNGDVLFTDNSSISNLGKDSDSLLISGDIFGEVRIQGDIGTTGYIDQSPDDDDDPENNNAEQTARTSGRAIAITGNVSNGVVLDGGIPGNFQRPSEEEVSTPSIRVFGSGNALFIDGGVASSTIGASDTSSITANENDDENVPNVLYGTYGLINRADLEADGVYSGVSAEVVRLQNVTISDGIRNDQRIGADAVEAVATAISFGQNLSTPLFRNDGSIVAFASGSGANSVAVNVEANANLPELYNENRISAVVVSDDGDAVAIQDLSGSINYFENGGIIFSELRDDSDNDPATEDDNGQPAGEAIAYDFRANSSGIEIYNTVFPEFPSDATDRSAVGFVTGNVYTGSGNDIYRSDAGSTVGDIWLLGGDDTVDLSMNATIEGNVNFGTGANSLVLDNGSVTGDLVFGTGSSSISLTDGGIFQGSIFADDPLAISVEGSSLILGGETDISVSSLTIAPDTDGNSSILGIAVTDNGNNVSRITSSGTVSIADATEIRTTFDGAFKQDISQTIISAGTLDVDLSTIELNADGSSPFLFTQSLERGGTGDNDLLLTLTRKNAVELGISENFRGAYEPVITALTNDQELGSALFNATTQEEFLDAYNQVLGAPLDAPIAYAQAQNNSVTSILAQRTERVGEQGRLRNTFWLQEQNYFLDSSADAATGSNGFDGGGFILALGADTSIGPIDVVGIAGHIASARYDEQNGNDFPFDRVTYGVDAYFGDAVGPVSWDGRVGYAMSSSESERVVQFGGERRNITGEWDGTQITANGRVRFTQNIGRNQITPFAGLDYVSITEDAYTEQGDDYIALDLEERESESMQAKVGLTLSRVWESDNTQIYEFSERGTFIPRLSVGWSQELITDDYEGTYRFVTPEDFTGEAPESFLVTAQPEDGAAFVAADVGYENTYAKVHMGVSGQFGDKTNVYQLRLGVGLKW